MTATCAEEDVPRGELLIMWRRKEREERGDGATTRRSHRVVNKRTTASEVLAALSRSA
eukprot:CAMPEP_0194781624 /NCGR_PEP_ID=MMETSP0323_2-20130528/76819_1 /TAXON_ID=2866 ORGANISM="Crypthecodinium cohnii, Strain Seligo" /NCGR_SAMPLE_ID=MMETSP0323_2 /ASSEMBLY_ACC=CAM_ASM_000346 /LENGTH=57 /DNA_ID=CAMNT_0039720125 /DNA_START=73 /DNA_END=243 /DNA_ORIENTATION=+